MARNCTVADAHAGNLGKSRLQSRQQLTLQLRIELISGVLIFHISADVHIEQDRILDLVGILTEALDGDIHIQIDIGVDNAERNRVRGTVLIADDILGVEIIDPLIRPGVSAEADTLLERLKAVLDALPEAALENGRLCRGIPLECAGHGTDLNDLALLDDHHALAFVDNNDRAIRNHIVAAMILAASALALLALLDKNVIRHGRTIEVLLPLICQYAADCACRNL